MITPSNFNLNSRKNQQFYEPVIKEKIRLSQQKMYDMPEEKALIQASYKACNKVKALLELALQKNINNISFKFKVTKIVCDFVW